MAAYMPPPGKQDPGKYQNRIGPNYLRLGEQPGWIYVPQLDRYFLDPKDIQQQYKNQGLIEDPPKPPGLAQTIGLPVAMLGGGALAQELGKNAPSYLGGLLGSGGANSAELATSFVRPEGLVPMTTVDSPALSALGGSGGGGLFELGGIGSSGNALLPAAGLIGFGDLIANKRKGGRGIAQGAASGAAMGSYFGPWGAGIGAGAGALLGLGSGLLDRGYSDLEDQKRAELAGQGIDLGSGDGLWEQNQAFAGSRDESALRGEDIIGAADWHLKLGQPWRDTADARKVEIANEAIKRGLVREHNGGIDINTEGLQDFLKNQNQPAQPTPMPRGGLL